jgi:predicted alpha-1,6-mannanase (GH76 family)
MVFSARPEVPAALSYPAGAAVELSTQLQAWMVLEAAASIAEKAEHPAPGTPAGN